MRIPFDFASSIAAFIAASSVARRFHRLIIDRASIVTYRHGYFEMDKFKSEEEQ
jgi:hypothetical protein